MAVQSNISAGYLSAFGTPLSVSVTSKISQWPFLQQLGFNGSLSSQSQTFHGLSDFNTQITAYSSTSGLLSAAFAVIKKIVLKNSKVLSLMFNSPVLGQVGNLFKQLSNFGQVFSIPPAQLKVPSSIKFSINIAAKIPVSLPSFTVDP
jgi:hypothetical protein